MIIKLLKEDFLVDEILDESFLSETPTNQHLYLMKKKNYTSERAVAQIAQSLGLPRKNISYAGTKDKNAITTQYITIKGVAKEKVDSLELKDISLEFKGYAKKYLGLGDLAGNKFTLVVRDLSESQTLSFVEKNFIVPDYFDEQRFSSNNIDLGLLFLKKDFKGAVELLKDDRDSDKIFSWLETHTNDYVGALQQIPKKILLFYIHAVQSKLYNELLKKTVEKLLSESSDNSVVTISYSQGEFSFPKKVFTDETLLEQFTTLIGYVSDLTEDEEKVMLDLGLTQNDFIIKQFPSITLGGSRRTSFFKVKNCEIKKAEPDEEFEGKFKQTISFDLGKGSYATIVLKQLYLL